MKHARLALLLLAFLLLGAQADAEPDAEQARLEAIAARLRVPPGFVIEPYAGNVPGARSMTWGAKGTLFVGTRIQRKVYALVDGDEDGLPERVHVIASALSMPNGVAFRDGSLYVAEIHRVLRYDGIEERLHAPPQPVVVRGDLPRDRHHGWKYIAFGPDGHLYVPVGAPCNVCERPAPYATILRMRPDGQGLQVFAEGVRNTVGFDWHPKTNELWFTDNGRDWLGDDLPPDELNRAPVPGLHFGFPYLHGTGVVDPELGARRGTRTYTPPVQDLGPHVAALGMKFYRGTAFPEAWRHQVFLAEHGSWNRSRRIGYQVSVVRIEEGRSVGYAPFATGWLQGETVLGRPVDVLETKEGHLLVSDDHAGAIWRIRHVGEGAR